MGNIFDEESFGSDGPKVEHYIFDQETGETVTDLTQEGVVAGLQAGDRVRYTDQCFEWLAGKEATVVGFSADDRVWTRLDGHTGCLWTANERVLDHMIKIVPPAPG